jgi:hypothetical protein
VRSVHGVITCPPESGDPLPGALFEIQGPGANRKIRRAATGIDGRFRIPHVPPGEYRFKLTYNGNRSVMGAVIVTRHAQQDEEIAVEMSPGARQIEVVNSKAC